MRILIYTGKGGVGKTSIAAATAVELAKREYYTLAMSVDPAHSLGDSLALSLEEAPDGAPNKITEYLDAIEIDSVIEGRRAWSSLRDYLKEIISEKAAGGIDADEALLFPGLEELFSLLRILDFYDEARYDVIIVDCAPTGETLSLLRYPERLNILSDALLPSVRSMNHALGALISRATTVPKPRDVVFEEFDGLVKRLNRLQGILRDRTVTSIRLVTTPERIVIDEARRSYTWLQMYDFGVDAVYINKIYPPEALQGDFAGWAAIQEKNIQFARESFPEQKKFSLMLQKGELHGFSMLEQSAKQLYADENAATIFCREQAFRIEEQNGTRVFIIRMPYADDLHVQKDGCDLTVSFRNETRRFHLPEQLSRRKLSAWSYIDGELQIQMNY